MKLITGMAALVAGSSLPHVAAAHPGHEHFINATVHHSIEAALVLGCIALAAGIVGLLVKRWEGERERG